MRGCGALHHSLDLLKKKTEGITYENHYVGCTGGRKRNSGEENCCEISDSAYFYTSITFNPLEVADNIKKQGGFIPGIRPGKPTSDYLTNILNYIIFIGAVGLIIVCVIPFIFNGVFGANVSFGGTSIIIIVGVILETVKQIESQLLVRNYKGFLNN